MEILPIYVTSHYSKSANDFFKVYECYRILNCPPDKVTNLKIKSERVCRFCCKNSSETTFRKEAHIIPALLGNRYGLSDFECDSCNEKFSEYENDLANFLGLIRTINSVKGKRKKIPKFKSGDGHVIAVNDSFNDNFNGKIDITNSNKDSDFVEINLEEGIVTVSYANKPYTPINVYKSLLKIALSMLPEEDCDDFKLAFQYLLRHELDFAFPGANMIATYNFPLSLSFNNPVGILYKKRHPNQLAFKYVFALYCQNHIYELFLPLSKTDWNLCNGKDITLSWCPPVFTDREVAEYSSTIKIVERGIDLSGCEKIVGEVGNMKVKIENPNGQQIFMKDINTGAIITHLPASSRIIKVSIDHGPST